MRCECRNNNTLVLFLVSDGGSVVDLQTEFYNERVKIVVNYNEMVIEIEMRGTNK